MQKWPVSLDNEPPFHANAASPDAFWKPGGHGRSLLFALAGFSLLSLGDGLTKSTAGQWPGPAVAALRYSLGAAGLATILWRIEGRSAFRLPQPWLQFGRGAAVALSTLCFFIAVQIMPLATVTLVGFTTPMLTALLSAILLREAAPRLVWAVSGLAFLGVLLVIRPDVQGIGPKAFLPILSAASMAMLMIFNRAAAASAPPLVMQALIAAIAAPLLIVAAVALHFTGLPEFRIGIPPWTAIGAAAIVAVTASGAHWLIYLSTVNAPAALVAPTIYVQMLFAIVIGWLFFGDVPDRLTLVGGAIIVAAGLWLFRGQGVRRGGRRS